MTQQMALSLIHRSEQRDYSRIEYTSKSFELCGLLFHKLLAVSWDMQRKLHPQ